MTNGNVRVKRTHHGVFAYNVNDIYLGRSLDVYGEYSRSETDLFAPIVKPGFVALDVGANIGVHTVAFANLVRPGGLVIAIEPQRAAYQLLCANLALNEIDNVRTILAGAGRTGGHALNVDYGSARNFGGVEVDEKGNERIEIMTIDGLCLDRCHFIKIDVEGHEQSVIADANETIARFQPALYVKNDCNPQISTKFAVSTIRRSGICRRCFGRTISTATRTTSGPKSYQSTCFVYRAGWLQASPD